MVKATWITSKTGSWNSPDNWTGGTIPTTSSDVTVTQSNGPRIDKVETVKSLTLTQSTLDLFGTLNVEGVLTIGSSSVNLYGGSLNANTLSQAGTYGSIWSHGTINVNNPIKGPLTLNSENGLLKLSSPINIDASTSTVVIRDNSTFELNADASPLIGFYGAFTTLKLDKPSGFSGKIIGLVDGNVINLVGVSVKSAAYDGTTLKITTSTNQNLNYALSTSETLSTLHFTPDGNGGTDLYWGNLPTEPLTITGAIGQDTIHSTPRNEIFKLPAGAGPISFAGKAAEYSIKSSNNVVTVSDSVVHRDGTDTLSNLSRLKFSDVSVALDIPNNTINTQIYHLYQAVFGTMPEANGFKAWTDAAKQYGLNETQIAGYFVKYLESNPAYNTDSKIVEAFYQNVIGKPADPAVTKYLTDFMQTHSIGRDQVAVWFAEYEGNVTATAPHIDNGYWLL